MVRRATCSTRSNAHPTGRSVTDEIKGSYAAITCTWYDTCLINKFVCCSCGKCGIGNVEIRPINRWYTAVDGHFFPVSIQHCARATHAVRVVKGGKIQRQQCSFNLPTLLLSVSCRVEWSGGCPFHRKQHQFFAEKHPGERGLYPVIVLVAADSTVSDFFISYSTAKLLSTSIAEQCYWLAL